MIRAKLYAFNIVSFNDKENFLAIFFLGNKKTKERIDIYFMYLNFNISDKANTVPAFYLQETMKKNIDARPNLLCIPFNPNNQKTLYF